MLTVPLAKSGMKPAGASSRMARTRANTTPKAAFMLRSKLPARITPS